MNPIVVNLSIFWNSENFVRLMLENKMVEINK